MFLLFRFFITLIVVLFIGRYVPGFEIKNTVDAFFFAVILSAVNAIIRPLLTLITLPITIMTLGLFSFVINCLTFFIAVELSYGVYFHTFSALIWGGFIVWITGWITNRFIWRVNIY
jgi:putative membrane protein